MTTLATAIARALLNWARRLGRAILERLAKKAGMSAVDFYLERSYVWERRRVALLPIVAAAKRGTAARRKAVRRHQAAQTMRNLCVKFARWLARHLDEVTPRAVRAYCAASKAIIDRIPLHSAAERECAA